MKSRIVIINLEYGAWIVLLLQVNQIGMKVMKLEKYYH